MIVISPAVRPTTGVSFRPNAFFKLELVREYSPNTAKGHCFAECYPSCLISLVSSLVMSLVMRPSESTGICTVLYCTALHWRVALHEVVVVQRQRLFGLVV